MKCCVLLHFLSLLTLDLSSFQKEKKPQNAHASGTYPTPQKNAAQLDPLCRGEEDEMLCFIAFLCICVCAL